MTFNRPFSYVWLRFCLTFGQFKIEKLFSAQPKNLWKTYGKPLLLLSILKANLSSISAIPTFLRRQEKPMENQWKTIMFALHIEGQPKFNFSEPEFSAQPKKLWETNGKPSLLLYILRASLSSISASPNFLRRKKQKTKTPMENQWKTITFAFHSES